MKPLKYIIFVFALSWATAALAGEPLGLAYRKNIAWEMFVLANQTQTILS